MLLMVTLCRIVRRVPWGSGRPWACVSGKKMSGHMGAVRQSVQNLEVIKIDVERFLIAVRGAIPGASGGDVLIRSASKI